MGAALVGVNGVCVGVDTFVVAGGPLHGDLDRHGLFIVLGLDRDDLIVNNLDLFRRV